MSSVTRKSRSVRGRRREEISEKMMTTAETLLSDGANFMQLSMGQLCGAAEVPRSTFYLHFADRAELLADWLAVISSRLEQVGAAWWQLDGSAVRADVEAALAFLVHTYRPHAALMRELYASAAYEPILREQVDVITRRNVERLCRHIEVGQREGFVCTDLPPMETAAWLMAMAARGQHTLVAGASEPEVDRLVKGLADIVWLSLYAYAPSRTGYSA